MGAYRYMPLVQPLITALIQNFLKLPNRLYQVITLLNASCDVTGSKTSGQCKFVNKWNCSQVLTSSHLSCLTAFSLPKLSYWSGQNFESSAQDGWYCPRCTIVWCRDDPDHLFVWNTEDSCTNCVITLEKPISNVIKMWTSCRLSITKENIPYNMRKLSFVYWSVLQCSLASQTTRSSWLQMAAMQGTLLLYPVWHHLFAMKFFLWIIEGQGQWISLPHEARLLHLYHPAVPAQSQASWTNQTFTNAPSGFALWLWMSCNVHTSVMNSSAFCVMYVPGLGIDTLCARQQGQEFVHKVIFHDAWRHARYAETLCIMQV